VTFRQICGFGFDAGAQPASARQPISVAVCSLNVARRRRRSSRIVSYAVGNVGFRAVLRAARATFRPVLRAARATFRPVLRVVRATFRPVLRAARATFRPVLRVVRATFRPVLRAVRAVLRGVVLLVAIVFLPFCFDVAICPFRVRFHRIASLFADFAVVHGKSITFTFFGDRRPAMCTQWVKSGHVTGLCRSPLWRGKRTWTCEGSLQTKLQTNYAAQHGTAHH
jgi:hypothetical protein